MSRNFVNGLANFIVEGNLVSFTLTDQRMDGQGKPLGPAQTVSDVVMRLSDFQQMAGYLGDAAKQIERKTGGGGGGARVMPKQQAAVMPKQAPVMPKPSSGGQKSGGRPPLGAKLKPGS